MTTNSSVNSAATQLGVFAKYWQPGRVKTRLAASVGESAAAEIHRENIRVLLRRFGGLADPCVLSIAPTDREADFRAWLGAETTIHDQWSIQLQSGDQLGERMQNYFDRAFQAGHDRVVLIGSDSPTIPAASIFEAFESLREHDVVLGPAEDGGYYLVGARKKTPNIFHNIAWSSEVVWEQTVQQLHDHSLNWHALNPCYDIDHIEDLQRLQTELNQNVDNDGEIWNELRATIADALRFIA